MHPLVNKSNFDFIKMHGTNVKKVDISYKNILWHVDYIYCYLRVFSALSARVIVEVSDEQEVPSVTFIGPCIANIFSEYNQQVALFLLCIYFCKTLYMFETGFPSIISSTKLHIQRQAFVRPAASLDGMFQ